MRSTYKTVKIDPEQYTMLHGKTQYEVELVPGVLDLWVEMYATEPVTVSLLYTGGLQLPYVAAQTHAQFSVRTLNVLSVILNCSKSCTVCVCVSWKDLAQREKSEWVKSVIVPPRPAELQLSSLIDAKVRAQLERMGVFDEKLEISEEDNLEEDIDDEGFGVGYMEDEEPKPRPKKEKAKSEPAASSGDAPDVSPGVKPDSDAGPTPQAAP